MAEGPALEKRYPGLNRDRGFESHPLRQHRARVNPPRFTFLLYPLAERCPSWLKEHDWKSCVLLIAAPRVRIPLSPPCLRGLPHTLEIATPFRLLGSFPVLLPIRHNHFRPLTET